MTTATWAATSKPAMETKPENQDGVWDGEGPQPADSSPTVTCEFEHNADQCSFPMCDCSYPTSTSCIAETLLNSVPVVHGFDPGKDEGFAVAQRTAFEDGKIVVTPVTAAEMYGEHEIVPLKDDGMDEPFIPPVVPKRQPKRDRAKYMRVYRAQQKSARTR